jgi:hypothetical protein
MTHEVAARIAAGEDVNARDQVIFSVCVWMGGWVGVAATLVYKSSLYISLYIYIYRYRYICIYMTDCAYRSHNSNYITAPMGQDDMWQDSVDVGERARARGYSARAC